MDASGSDLPCVGKLEIAKPKPSVGFLCGTLPVLTDGTFLLPHSALVPSAQTIQAPRYQMLPTETDLNTLPILPNVPEKVIPVASRSEEDENWESCPINQNLSRKCEALAVSGLAEYGDEIDVVAPADILKQIFKMPYSKARLSIAVNRIGDTLILNTGPDIEEGEKMFRKQSSNQPRSAESSIFLNFAMHSVRAEACDCPPDHLASSEAQSRSTVLPGHYERRDEAIVSEPGLQSQHSKLFSQSSSECHRKRTDPCSEFPRKNKDKDFWGNKNRNDIERHKNMNTSSQIGEKLCGPVLDSDKYRRVGNNGFLRVLFWQFHNFRMLLGSDLLLFSNDKYIAVSLHLWDITRKVTPLSWLEAWLDNVMASVPELAICYHQNGVVQGYELIKTDDIFLLKGLSEDGTPAFHPQVVQQNGLSVLRFLQENCKQDPGAYWLYKSAGEDVIQLFDMSVLPKSNLADEHDISCSTLPSLMEKGRRDSLFSLGTLLYRVAHRLSLSKASDKKAKCAKFFKKCLNFVGEQDHLVVRAYAHEEFARLILRCYKELDITSESFMLESEVTVTDLDNDSSEFSLGMFGLTSHDCDHNLVTDDEVSPSPSVEVSRIADFETNSYLPRNISITEIVGEGDRVGVVPSIEEKERLTMLHFSTQSPHVQPVVDPVSSKLAAIHHVCQAIKSLRWNRQLKNAKGNLRENWSSRTSDRCLPPKFYQCTCGDPECIEVCDIREWLTKAKMDHKLWKLVLLLGESYLALGDAYREDGQLHQALRVVEIACSVYGSMPRHLEDAQFISSIPNHHPCQKKIEKESKKYFYLDTEKNSNSFSSDKYIVADQLSSSHLFWANAWTLVGDIFVDFHRSRNNAAALDDGHKSGKQLRMSNEVVKEVTRLKKKLGRFQQNCNTCSLINCSCQSDRVSSGSSASSSSGNVHSIAFGRKHGRKSNMKNLSNSISEISVDGHTLDKVKNPKCFGTGTSQKNDSNEGSALSSSKYYNSIQVPTKSQTEDVTKVQCVEARERSDSESIAKDASAGRHGGIFKFLQGPKIGNVEQNLLASVDCYDAAIQAMNGYQSYITETRSIVKKKGWVFNELGRYRLENKDLAKAEVAFGDAIKAFKAVSDHSNIILINYNLGYGRRAVAEEVVTEMENSRGKNLSQQAIKQSIKRAKVEYIESLKYYENAKAESDANIEATDFSFRNELYTQYANTYLRLGMLLAREETLEELSGSRHKEDTSICSKHVNNEKFIGRKKCDMFAGDAFREALAIYESLGELRKQEAAFAHFQLACYHRASCLKFLNLESKQSKHVKCESNNRQKAKWYASLAERNWQKARDFYGPKTHPSMFLDILLELSSLSHSLSNSLHSNAMLESALSHLLDGRHVIEEDSENSYGNLNPEIQEKFLQHLRALLKTMLASALCVTLNKEGISAPQTTNRTDDSVKLKDLYRMSLKANSLSHLYAMHQCWIA